MAEGDDSCEVISCSNIEKTDNAEADIAKANREAHLTSDHILGEIGGFGFYQILVGFVTGVAIILSSLDLFNFVFAAAAPEHRSPSPSTIRWTLLNLTAHFYHFHGV